MLRFQRKEFIITGDGLIPNSELNSKRDRPLVPNEIETCEEWLTEYSETYSKIGNESSYTLKHRVEDWADTYVSNGAFIQAAHNLGYRIKVINDGPNAYFGIKLLIPEEKWKYVRPIGFSRWLFKKKDENSVISHLAEDAFFDDTWPRKAEKFIDFLDYLKSLNAYDAINVLNTAWEAYSGEKAPYPNDEVVESCEMFYDTSNGQIINYEDEYPKAPAETTYIYVLFEEVNDSRKVKYVGQTDDPSTRLKAHITCPGTIDKVKWIGGLLNNDRYPKMGIIKSVPISEARILERTYMYAFEDFERKIDQKRGEILLNKVY